MDLLLLGAALVGLVVAKALLSAKERSFRNNRAQRKMHRILHEAVRSSQNDEFNQPKTKPESNKKPPPLPDPGDG